MCCFVRHIILELHIDYLAHTRVEATGKRDVDRARRPRNSANGDAKLAHRVKWTLVYQRMMGSYDLINKPCEFVIAQLFATKKLPAPSDKASTQLSIKVGTTEAVLKFIDYDVVADD